jgi:hypothetical protein
MIPRPRHTLWMLVLLVGTLAPLMSVGPNQHGPMRGLIEDEDFWDSYEWRVRYDAWRLEHPGAAGLLDQFEREVREQRKHHLEDDCTADCQ